MYFTFLNNLCLLKCTILIENLQNRRNRRECQIAVFMIIQKAMLSRGRIALSALKRLSFADMGVPMFVRFGESELCNSQGNRELLTRENRAGT